MSHENVWDKDTLLFPLCYCAKPISCTRLTQTSHKQLKHFRPPDVQTTQTKHKISTTAWLPVASSGEKQKLRERRGFLPTRESFARRRGLGAPGHEVVDDIFRLISDDLRRLDQMCLEERPMTEGFVYRTCLVGPEFVSPHPRPRSKHRCWLAESFLVKSAEWNPCQLAVLRVFFEGSPFCLLKGKPKFKMNTTIYIGGSEDFRDTEVFSDRLQSFRENMLGLSP